MENTIKFEKDFFSKNEFNIENTVSINEDTINVFDLLNEVENNSKDIKQDLNSNEDKVVKLVF